MTNMNMVLNSTMVSMHINMVLCMFIDNLYWKIKCINKNFYELFFHLNSTSLNSNSGNEFLLSSVLNSWYQHINLLYTILSQRIWWYNSLINYSLIINFWPGSGRSSAGFGMECTAAGRSNSPAEPPDRTDGPDEEFWSRNRDIPHHSSRSHPPK